MDQTELISWEIFFFSRFHIFAYFRKKLNSYVAFWQIFAKRLFLADIFIVSKNLTPISYQFFHFHFDFITNAIVWTFFPPVWRAFNITGVHSEKWYACKITWFSTFQIAYETRNLLTHRLHQWFNLSQYDLTFRIMYPHMTVNRPSLFLK